MPTGAGEQIRSQVTSWPGVTPHEHRFGGLEYRIGRIELGHVHGDRLVDLPFPRKLRDELIAEGRAEPHHVLSDSGWVSRYLISDEDVDDAVALFRLNYDRVMLRRSTRKA